jgi:hypothetical protein
LALIARKYLQIQATSASSKRFFSHGAYIITKTRNKLSKDRFGRIICLKNWGVYIEKNEIKEDLSGISNDFVI